MEPPLAARVDEPVGRQGLQDEIPAGALAAGLEARGPEGVQPEFRPQVTRQPAGAPLPRAPHGQLLQPDLHHRVVRDGGQPVLGKQGEGAGLGDALLEDLDGLAPGLALAVVDLAEVQHGPLHHAPARDAAGLDDAPVPVELAVLAAGVAALEHGGATLPLLAAR